MMEKEPHYILWTALTSKQHTSASATICKETYSMCNIYFFEFKSL